VSPFIWPVRVYYEDTDAGGVVYYANYLKFMERARTEWLRSLGIEQEPLLREDNVMFVVADMEAKFRRPARFGELLEVTSEVAESRRASITFAQEIWRGGAGAGELLLSGRVRVACLDARTFRPRSLPDRLAPECLSQVDRAERLLRETP